MGGRRKRGRERERGRKREGERERERERGIEREREREMYNMVIEFTSLLLTMAALQIKCFSNSLTRNKFFNCPD